MKLCKGAVLALAVSYGLIYCHTNKSKFMLEQKGDSLTLIHITNPTNYILLPIEEAAEESRVRLDIGDAADTDMDIRLAQTKVDYWVPFVLPADAKTVTVRVQKSLGDALCWKEMKLSDTFDPSHIDKFRPVSYEDTQNIIDNLKGRKPVIVNMEQIEVETAQRILDFMSGACYAVDGRLYKVSARIFLVAPANYDIIGSSDGFRE